MGAEERRFELGELAVDAERRPDAGALTEVRTDVHHP
jgi:hypothetical protein